MLLKKSLDIFKTVSWEFVYFDDCRRPSGVRKTIFYHKLLPACFFIQKLKLYRPLCVSSKIPNVGLIQVFFIHCTYRARFGKVVFFS